ncbi:MULTISPECIES: YkgJ family cysteine cluster protein [unclassified Campylobacter]|uniref:YkgJ family cysteine cluster protein n=1 Tax=unclassified Campylobacter TaxID=2593542 RepID=UPI001237B89F|nr:MULTISPECIES: YkgJ family cysteine cluster protein [unclassified Campylobacter]KAA6226433.1 YkgJ family cysteine cluster protein [Campylobacter sp. LR286c]KAA6226529.1 YkgJ family cysteine cluster protein [Campylobacter sp. LR185c]KAA6226921.1 YkgJ family cysteine cluster protein [Campylobacter sp. LR196d]KAA6233665.1 YkgJ family cysteine cluster protein [Campylobacter sp. LR291e]KAA6233885.1 YkgJ family cysteine cluster protein [Campylobacter sp. LR264d]
MIFEKNFPYSFNENACKKCGGKCCTGESGNIFASKEELELIRKHLSLEKDEFKDKFLKKVGFRLSFKEVEFKNGFACIFFDTKRLCCSIYALRPSQCKSFPFWEYYKTHIEEVKKECIGICFLS